MKRHQVVAGRGEVTHLVDLFAATGCDRAFRVLVGPRGGQPTARRGVEPRFEGTTLDHLDDAARAAVIVDRAPLSAAPGEDQDLVVGPGADDGPAVTRLIESDRLGQVRRRVAGGLAGSRSALNWRWVPRDCPSASI